LHNLKVRRLRSVTLRLLNWGLLFFWLLKLNKRYCWANIITTNVKIYCIKFISRCFIFKNSLESFLNRQFLSKIISLIFIDTIAIFNKLLRFWPLRPKLTCNFSCDLLNLRIREIPLVSRWSIVLGVWTFLLLLLFIRVFKPLYSLYFSKLSTWNPTNRNYLIWWKSLINQIPTDVFRAILFKAVENSKYMLSKIPINRWLAIFTIKYHQWVSIWLVSRSNIFLINLLGIGLDKFIENLIFVFINYVILYKLIIS